MRLSGVLLFLSAIATADDQNPLREKAAAWFDRAKSYLPSTAPPSPIDAGASHVAELLEEKITFDNWRRKMLPITDDPAKGPEEWIVMFSGNSSCFGRCERADKAFNESVAILASDVSPPRLGRVDCDEENLLCTTWSNGVPEVWHFFISATTKGQPRAPSALHIVPIYPKNVTTQDVVKIRTEKTYLSRPEYTGAYHPVDGLLARRGLLDPLGYVVWGLGSVPSWLFMIVISLFSRQLMARRTGGGRPDATGRQPQAQFGSGQQ